MLIDNDPKAVDLFQREVEVLSILNQNTQIILQILRDIESVLAATKSVQNITKNLVNKVSQAPLKLEHTEIWRRLFAHIIDLIILFLFGTFMRFSIASLVGVSSNSDVKKR